MGPVRHLEHQHRHHPQRRGPVGAMLAIEEALGAGSGWDVPAAGVY